MASDNDINSLLSVFLDTDASAFYWRGETVCHTIIFIHQIPLSSNAQRFGIKHVE